MLCLVAVATFVCTSVSERFMHLTVDVFLEVLTTSTTQNCNSLSKKKALYKRRFFCLRLFDVSPTETAHAQNESFTERNKVDFLQNLAIWYEAIDEHWKDTQRFRCNTEASASSRSRTRGKDLVLYCVIHLIEFSLGFVLSFWRALSRFSF